MIFESLGEALGKGILQISTVRARKWQRKVLEVEENKKCGKA
jgi:hypothetical protein